jgi:hypothetical protein
MIPEMARRLNMITNNLLIKLKTRNWDNVARAKEVLLSM